LVDRGAGLCEGDAEASLSPDSRMLTRIRDLFRQDDRRSRCERALLPHLDAAYNLARWLTRNDQDAEEVWQTACLRAVQFFDGFQGTDARAWLLTIVRRSFYTWLQQRNRRQEIAEPFDEEVHTVEAGGPDPEAELLRRADARLLHAAFEALPLPFREIIVLREIEGMSYKEIAAIVGSPLGTVMSRLARARRHLQEFLIERGVRGSS
jgi:RNA polymerase sigma factor (sigma-70 family)